MAKSLYCRAVKFNSAWANCNLANVFDEEGDSKMAICHFEAAAIAGHEVQRSNLGVLMMNIGNFLQS